MIALTTMMGVCGCLLAALPPLGGIYVACLIIGGGLLVISTVFGGDHDSDFDTGGHLEVGEHADLELDAGDLDADADLGLDQSDLDSGGLDHGELEPAGAAIELGHAGGASNPLSLSDWFSMRFVVYFAAVFGFIGTVLNYMTDVAAGWTLAVSLVSGLVCGQGVHQAIRALGRSGGNSEVAAKDFLNKPARVTIAVRPPARGEVGVLIGNREMFLPAVAQRSDDRFGIGDQVVITAYTGGMVEVVSRKEYEFVNRS